MGQIEKIANTKNLKVMTPSGWKEFSGMRRLKNWLWKIDFESGNNIEVTKDHPFSIITDNKERTVYLSELYSGDRLQTTTGYDTITNIVSSDKFEWTYDLLDVDGAIYYANNIVSHNCFLETGNSAVDSSLLDMFRSMVHDPIYTFEDGNYKVWKEPDSTHLYAIGVDVGEGIGQAASVANVIDITDLTNIEVVATYHNNKIDPFHFGELLHKIANQWGRPMLAIERNNCGGQVIDALKEKYNYHNIIDHSPKTMSSHGNYYSRLGIYSHTNAKYQGIMNMRYWVNSLKAVKVYDIGLIQELETFVRYPNGTWKAKQGDYIYDDRVMSLVWGLFVLENEIAEKYYDIQAFDDRGKPLKITPVNVEPVKYFNLNTDFINNPNGPMPTVINPSFSTDPEGVDALEQQGWEIYNK